MQQVMERLWIGPFSAARQKQTMLDCRITHILVIRDKNETNLVRPLYPDTFNYQIIEASDSPHHNLIPQLPRATHYIHSVLSVASNSILVHCNGGISRAPSICIAYLMEFHGFAFPAAFQHIQNIRFCINPLEAFKYQLREYEFMIQARRVSSAQLPSDAHGTRRARSASEDHDENDVRVWDREEGRFVFSPRE